MKKLVLALVLLGSATPAYAQQPKVDATSKLEVKVAPFMGRADSVAYTVKTTLVATAKRPDAKRTVDEKKFALALASSVLIEYKHDERKVAVVFIYPWVQSKDYDGPTHRVVYKPSEGYSVTY